MKRANGKDYGKIDWEGDIAISGKKYDVEYKIVKRKKHIAVYVQPEGSIYTWKCLVELAPFTDLQIPLEIAKAYATGFDDKKTWFG